MRSIELHTKRTLPRNGSHPPSTRKRPTSAPCAAFGARMQHCTTGHDFELLFSTLATTGAAPLRLAVGEGRSKRSTA
eukprot:1049822-Amphidinium_carterae.1